MCFQNRKVVLCYSEQTLCYVFTLCGKDLWVKMTLMLYILDRNICQVEYLYLIVEVISDIETFIHCT